MCVETLLKGRYANTSHSLCKMRPTTEKRPLGLFPLDGTALLLRRPLPEAQTEAGGK
jgi:hypothetical protein